MSTAAVTAVASIAAALITALSVYAVAAVGRRTSHESQGVQALGEAVDGYRELLGDTRVDLQGQIDHLRRRVNEQQSDINTLRSRIQSLRGYARQLRDLLREHRITVPDPPHGAFDDDQI